MGEERGGGGMGDYDGVSVSPLPDPLSLYNVFLSFISPVES